MMDWLWLVGDSGSLHNYKQQGSYRQPVAHSLKSAVPGFTIKQHHFGGKKITILQRTAVFTRPFYVYI